MGSILKLVTAGAVGVIAYRAWQRRQGLATDTQQGDTQQDGSTPPHVDPLRGALQNDAQRDTQHAAGGRAQALGALSVFHEQERTLAQLAVTKGVVGEVLEFARKMDQAHSAALTDLSRFGPDRSSAQAKSTLAQFETGRKRLDGLHAQEFEREYLQASVISHEKALAVLDAQVSSEPGSSDLGKELKRERDMIAEHLEHARGLKAKRTQTH
ncbi:DUF4142 domain-containing protein [Xanthomonas campestris]|uniref:DUF4142 domain-containing protein n=1 Tax=Xanthomonas campestris TaxID=339 RepID=UPI002B237630|nr:DUF4142 domain-containing protein [Xanthomonas campestris]MEA9732108.1 DUF4142 domain-containing protein [Xanthomonas campestris]